MNEYSQQSHSSYTNLLIVSTGRSVKFKVHVDRKHNFEIQFATLIIQNTGVQNFFEFSHNINMCLS